MFRVVPTECPNCHRGLDEVSLRAGDRRFSAWQCPNCDGQFVAGDILEKIFAEISAAPPELMEFQNEEAHQRCPLCLVLLRRVWLDFLFFEKCSEHGYWFDSGKLALALRHVGEAPLVTAKDLAGLAPRPKGH